MKIRLRDAAAVIRSKNAGPYELPLDVILKDREMYERMKAARVIRPDVIAGLYRIPEEKVLEIVWFDAAKAVKATIVRPMPSGALGERDVYGAQQHAPLMDFEFEL